MFLFIGTTLNIISKEKPGTIDIAALFISSGGFILAKTQELPLLIFMYIIYFTEIYIYSLFFQ